MYINVICFSNIIICFSPFMPFYFIFLPSTFSGTRIMCIMHCIPVALAPWMTIFFSSVSVYLFARKKYIYIHSIQYIDLARDKSEALLNNTCKQKKKLNCVMLNGDNNENGFKTNRSNQQKNKMHVQHTFSSNQQKTNLQVRHDFLSFLCRCFARLQGCFVRLRACLHGGGGPQVGEVT